MHFQFQLGFSVGIDNYASWVEEYKVFRMEFMSQVGPTDYFLVVQVFTCKG